MDTNEYAETRVHPLLDITVHCKVMRVGGGKAGRSYPHSTWFVRVVDDATGAVLQDWNLYRYVLPNTHASALEAALSSPEGLV